MLCSADDKIQQLIATLELRKDESIERTFKGVAKNFRYSMCSHLRMFDLQLDTVVCCAHLPSGCTPLPGPSCIQLLLAAASVPDCGC